MINPLSDIIRKLKNHKNASFAVCRFSFSSLRQSTPRSAKRLSLTQIQDLFALTSRCWHSISVRASLSTTLLLIVVHHHSSCSLSAAYHFWFNAVSLGKNLVKKINMLASSPPGGQDAPSSSYGDTGGSMGMGTPSPAPYNDTISNNTMQRGNEAEMMQAYNDDAELDHHEEDDGYNEWDEGGPSQCGYHEAVHYTLMTVGRSVHGVVGGPSQGMERSMKTVGNWFQEASYAVRDFCRGNKQELGDDASEALSTMKDDAMAVVNDIMGTNSMNNAVDANALNEAAVSGAPYKPQTF
jgi:hypothetical protein